MDAKRRESGRWFCGLAPEATVSRMEAVQVDGDRQVGEPLKNIFESAELAPASVVLIMKTSGILIK